MAENVIDTLKLDIIVNTKNSGQSVRTVTNNLEKLYKFLDGIQNKDFNEVSKSVTKLTNTLKPLFSFLSESNIAGAGRAISSLNSFLKNLDKNIDSIDSDKLAKKFSEMATAIDPFLSKINSAQESLVALNGVMGGAKTLTKTAKPKATTNSNILGGKLGKSLNFGSIIAKLYFIRNITKQLGQDLAKVVQYGIDYEETLNLWQTAMRGNISQARVFTNEMTKAYGISSATLMNYQATFKNMLGALGNISETTAYGLSEALTQMALDFSSLYNVSVESAMTKFQAVLSGQVRPIRVAGYDITEQTLFQLYQSIGGTKTVRQLNQTEKQLLRILVVYKQMERSGATGDLAKTLASSANQIRMMGEQSKEFATWIGVGFNTLMEKSGILVNINAGLYAATELAKAVAYSLGYVETDWGIEIADGVDEANKEVDELKGKLLGFDKFQVLQSGVGEDDGTDITQSLLDAIKDYQKIYEGVENPAVSKATQFLEILGGKLVDVKNEAGEVVGQIWEFPPAVKEAATAIGSLVASITILTAIAIEKKLLSMISGFLGLSNASLILTTVGFAAVIYGVVTLLTKWDELDDMAKILTIAITVLGVAMSFPTLKTGLLNLFSYAKGLDLVTTKTKLLHAASFACAVAGIYFLVNGMNEMANWNEMSGLEKAITVLKILAGAALIAAAAVAVFHTSWTVGVAAGAIAAGIALTYGAIQAVKSQQKDLEFHANGGLATKGSLFYAGEAGPELVTQTSGGGSTIMNMKQLEDAVARGMIRGLAATDSGEENGEINIYVDGQKLFNIQRGTARRNGYDYVRV